MKLLLITLLLLAGCGQPHLKPSAIDDTCVFAVNGTCYQRDSRYGDEL